MGRKNKNTLGGAASGASAGAAAGPWGALAGGVLGGVLGSQNDSDAQQLAPAVPQEVVDRLYRQAQGGEVTAGELKAAQMFDKTLAQQIAAAKAARGTNPALLQRNVSRIAAEQSQNAAAQGAEIAAQERAKAMSQYLAAQQLNAGVAAQNAGFEAAADKQANNMLAGGFNALAGNLALGAQKADATKQLEAQNQKIATDSNSVKEPINTANLNLGSTEKAQQVNSAYGLGANTDLSGYGDMKITSDERQKDLIKTEDLPQNNNMGMQNMQAQQPAGQEMQAPPPPASTTAAPVVSAPPQTTAKPEASKTSNFGLTSEMLLNAQQSSKRGGNVADIQNASVTLQRGAQGPSQSEIVAMAQDAKNRESRDMFGNVTQSDAENYQANLGRWYAARDAQNAAYDKQAGEVALQNQAKDAQRVSRLNRFYTGIDTAGGAIASQYKAPEQMAASDWGSANTAHQQAFRAATGQDFRSGGAGGWGGLAATIAPQLAAQYELAQTSDEDEKTDKKKDQKSDDFNPKSFLDKLEAYSYEYKKSAEGKPGVDDERHLGVMAQDLEKAGPVGQSMVDEDETGTKVVDYGKGFSAILASQAHLNKRLEQIEKMYSKKKKD